MTESTSTSIGCSICLDYFRSIPASTNAEVVTPCGHIFHKNCLNTWLHQQSSSKSCPDCRSPLCEEQVKRVFFHFSSEHGQHHSRHLHHLVKENGILKSSYLVLSDDYDKMCELLKEKEGIINSLVQQRWSGNCARISQQANLVENEIDQILLDIKSMEADVGKIEYQLEQCELDMRREECGQVAVPNALTKQAVVCGCEMDLKT